MRAVFVETRFVRAAKKTNPSAVKNAGGLIPAATMCIFMVIPRLFAVGVVLALFGLVKLLIEGRSH
jgi:hypothetical protein